MKFDLTDTWAISYLAPLHEDLKAKLEEVGSTLPGNRAAGPAPARLRSRLRFRCR